MSMISFMKRNILEIIRDPLSILFALLLPAVLLIIFQQFDIPSDLYSITNMTPGIILFSLGFISLFIAQLIAKDRKSLFLSRLYISPLKTFEFILGYTFALLPLVCLQYVVIFLLGLCFHFPLTINLFYAFFLFLPISLFFIFFGILIGTISTEKSASGIGSIVVQLVAFTSGMYFSSEMMGKGFAIFCKVLPFQSSLNLLKAVLSGKRIELYDLCLVFFYLILMVTSAILLFKKKTKPHS